jgi:hypothetical protein
MPTADIASMLRLSIEQMACQLVITHKNNNLLKYPYLEPTQTDQNWHLFEQYHLVIVVPCHLVF